MPLRNCWGTKTISGIFVAETEGLAENRIVKAPLHFESQYGDELKLRYRLRVKQLAISSENYYFWKEFDQLINQTGGLYEIVPYRLTGNIICTSNPSSNVTGIFEVAGVSEKAMYFDTPVEFPVYGYECEAVEWDLSVIDPKTGDLVWIDDATGTWYTADPECFDCTLRGGTTEMPAFWEF